MARHYNFSAGPAALPTSVLERAQQELLDWQSRGVSVMEVSHRGAPFMAMAQQAQDNLRRLMSVPDSYEILFFHGSASHQFSMVPMNFLRQGDKADYIVTGTWSQKAATEAARFGEVNEVQAVVGSEHGQSIRSSLSWKLRKDSRYLHYAPNETIAGIEFQREPTVDGSWLVADMSSNILSREIDVTKYGLIYAGAQKNIGPSGLTIVIVKKDLLKGLNREGVPALFQYDRMAEHQSLYNTPPSFAWYLAGQVFEWLLEQGGVAEMERRNIEKSQLLYNAIDDSDFYHNPVAPECRSRMNIPFTLADPKLDQTFLEEAEQAGLVALKGHRSVGGMRASIYNAMPIEGVQALVDFMVEFEEQFG